MDAILKFLTLPAIIGVVMSAPITTVYNTPLGPGYVTQYVSPDGVHFWTASGPGFTSSSYSYQGGPDPDDGIPNYQSNSAGIPNYQSFSANSVGFPHALDGGISQQYSGGYYNSYGGGIGNIFSSSSSSGFGMPSIIKPMKFPKFEWWPSIFE